MCYGHFSLLLGIHCLAIGNLDLVANYRLELILLVKIQSLKAFLQSDGTLWMVYFWKWYLLIKYNTSRLFILLIPKTDLSLFYAVKIECNSRSIWRFVVKQWNTKSLMEIIWWLLPVSRDLPCLLYGYINLLIFTVNVNSMYLK